MFGSIPDIYGQAVGSLAGMLPQQSLLIDVGALLEIMSEVRRSIESCVLRRHVAVALIDRIEAVETFAARPQPHQAMLLALMKYLPPR